MEKVFRAAWGDRFTKLLKEHPEAIYFGGSWESLINFDNKILYMGDTPIAGHMPIFVQRLDGTYAHADIPKKEFEKYADFLEILAGNQRIDITQTHRNMGVQK